MAAKKSKKDKAELEALKAGIFKGYDIRWLKNQPDHPDFGLVEKGEAAIAKARREK